MANRRERIRQRTAAIWNDTKYAGVGLEFGISIALCCWLGRWAQERWDFAPWGVFIGVILGFTAGLRRLIKIAEAESQSFSTHVQSSHSTSSSPTESEYMYDSRSDATDSADFNNSDSRDSRDSDSRDSRDSPW